MAAHRRGPTVQVEDKNSEVEIIEPDKDILWHTPSALAVKRPLVGRSVPLETLYTERRVLARQAIATLHRRDNNLDAIALLNQVANAPVTDIVPASFHNRALEAERVTTGDNERYNFNMPAINESELPLIKEPKVRRPWFGLARTRAPTTNDIKNMMPIRYDFDPHPEDDRPNSWFENTYAVLFDRIIVFARDYFGFIDLGSAVFFEPWKVRMPREFYRWVEDVAEPEPDAKLEGNTGWDELLKSTDMRRFLIVAIIVRIIEVKIFDQDLWGADERQEELLQSLNKALVFGEGYSRQQLRAQTVRTVLDGEPTTANFHTECSRLTAQIMLLFLPLFNYLSGLPPTHIATPDIKHAYQALHNIISQAAYISICMRLSTSIIHIAHLTPGTPYDPEDHVSLMQDQWTYSKNRNVAAWRTEHTKLEAERAAAEGYKLGYEAAGRQNTRAGRKATERAKVALAAVKAHRPPNQMFRAAVKIACWPSIRRYSPGNGKLGGELDGQTIYPLSQAGGVFYYKNRALKAPGLAGHIRAKRKLGGRSEIDAILQFLTVTFVLIMVYLSLLRYSARHA